MFMETIHRTVICLPLNIIFSGIQTEIKLSVHNLYMIQSHTKHFLFGKSSYQILTLFLKKISWETAQKVLKTSVPWMLPGLEKLFISIYQLQNVRFLLLSPKHISLEEPACLQWSVLIKSSSKVVWSGCSLKHLKNCAMGKLVVYFIFELQRLKMDKLLDLFFWDCFICIKWYWNNDMMVENKCQILYFHLSFCPWIFSSRLLPLPRFIYLKSAFLRGTHRRITQCELI